MRNSLIIALILLTTACSNDLSSLDIISLNIRYDNPRDGKNAWPYRKEMVVDFLDSLDADIFGLQEVLFHQYSYIDSLLPEYGSVFAGRDDGIRRGEMAPVFYDKNRFECMDHNTFWLSETPEIPGSKGWGAALPRIVSWVELSDKRTGKEIFFFNTHFSHMSDSARLMSSKILAERVMEISGDNEFIITGDFNMLPESGAYLALAGGENNTIKDSYHLSNSDPEGADYTYNGFDDEPGEGRIDYIFVRAGIQVDSFRIIELRKGDLFLSDHWPVRARLNLK